MPQKWPEKERKCLVNNGFSTSANLRQKWQKWPRWQKCRATPKKSPALPRPRLSWHPSCDALQWKTWKGDPRQSGLLFRYREDADDGSNHGAGMKPGLPKSWRSLRTQGDE